MWGGHAFETAVGRGFLPEEDKIPGGHPVVVISYKLWQTRFGATAAIVGRNVRLNGHSFTIVGVAKEKYPGLIRGLAGLQSDRTSFRDCAPFQIPCIERNALGAVKAINAARMALRDDGIHKVSLDQVIKTMYETGLDMQTRYKETSQGGLAANVVEC